MTPAENKKLKTRNRVRKCRAKKARKVEIAAKKDGRRIALLARKKAKLSESRKGALRAKKRAERTAANLQDKHRQQEAHAALGCCDHET